MKEGHFYYIKNKYFELISNGKLMKNKIAFDGKEHNRPCFYAFQDNKTKLFWLIPISSQVEKYKIIYDKKISKYKKCDTLIFGKVLGYQKAFLLQNMFPVSEEFINNEYMDNNTNRAVMVEIKLEKLIMKKARKLLAMYRKGINLIFTDPDLIEAVLSQKIDKSVN